MSDEGATAGRRESVVEGGMEPADAPRPSFGRTDVRSSETMSRVRIAVSGSRLHRAALGLGIALALGVPATAEEQVFGVQLHLHGSMSEGRGSMAGHDHAARALGGAVDVIWWSDHDWRIAAHTYVEGDGFEEGLQRSMRVPTTLTARQRDGRDPLPAWARAGGESHASASESIRVGWQRVRGGHDAPHAKVEVGSKRAREGEKSLHVELDGRGTGWQRAALSFGADRRRHIASLASEVRAALSVWPEQLEGDAGIIVSFILSQQPPNEQGRLEYRLSEAGRTADERTATTRIRRTGKGGRVVRSTRIELPWEPGRWNDLVFDLSGDAERYGHGGIDNSMAEVMLSIEAHTGRVEAYFDRLRIERSVVGLPLFERQKQMASALSDDGLMHHVGQEVSYGAHLNVFGARVPLADLATHPHGHAPAEAVELAHAHGGIASLNHVFGTSPGLRGSGRPTSRERFDERVARLVALRGYGADLLEVGYRERGLGLEFFVELWDRLAANGVYMTGVGVSDSHDNDVGWREGPNNFITWVRAESREQQALIDALRAGRAFFGDPTRFDGHMQLEIEGGGRMGDVVVVRPGARKTVRYRASGLRGDQRVRLVRNGESTRTFEPAGADVDVRETIVVDARGFVRFEIVEDGAAVALSNPIYFVLPGEDVPAWRRVR